MAGITLIQGWSSIKEQNVTRKESALDALNKKIPKFEEKINQDKQLLEQLEEKRETLEVEMLRTFLHENGLTTEEIIARLTTPAVSEQKNFMEDRKNEER